MSETILLRLLGASLVCAMLAACQLVEQDAGKLAHELARQETAAVVADVDDRVSSPTGIPAEELRFSLAEAGRILGESTSGAATEYDISVERRVETGGGWTAESATAQLCFRVSVTLSGTPGATHHEIDCPPEVSTTTPVTSDP